ncbi:hypothetical protein WGC32_07810 [Zongyangia sp. HA2173]|uniref:hypothetical protein n=1 Tax=Zongyangia sp. HA2173 TaxID=3133035 RepID=UPI00315F4427
MKLAKKILAAVLASCMAILTFAGCGSQDTSWIATDKDGNAIPVGVYLYHRLEAYTEALDLVEDKAGEAWDQEIEGKTGYEWVHDKALQAVKNYAAVEEKFEELGYTLAEEQEAYAENQATQRYNYYSGLYEANGISSDSVVAIYMNQMKSSVIFQNTYAPGGTQGLSVDELKQELEENYLRFKTIMLPRTNSDGVLLSDEELAAAEEEQANYLKRAQDGEDFDQLIIESEDNYIKDLRGDESYEPTTSDYGHDHAEENAHVSVLRKDSTDVSAELLDAVAAVDEGEFGTVEDIDYYYVFQRLDITEDEDAVVEALEAQLTSDLKADDFDKEIEDWGNNVQLTLNDKAVDYYQKRKFKEASF